MRRKNAFAAGVAIVASACCFFGAAAASGETVVELFQKAKQQVKLGSYGDALKTLDALDTATAAPGHEAERRQVEPPIAFYRGVSFAALGRKDEARASFQKYLGFAPNASMDASMYPKKAVAAFEEARKGLGPAAAPESASIDGSYANFRLAGASPPETPNEAWGDGPVKFLMSSDEKREWAKASDPISRSEFVTKFWASRDTKPETPENEFRQEFERRVAYSDATFVQGEVRGSMTDRGMVFVLLGPPTYVGRKPLGTGDDTSDAAGMSTAGSHDAQTAIAAANAAAGGGAGGKTSGAKQSAIADRAAGTRITDSGSTWREVWHYRRERLPTGVPYQQVDFDFITRRGYGENVLQRDSNSLNTLEAARRIRKSL
ncbi:MAG: GWxTD domain-containing protein [Acidobacteriota bacterium]|nr:GWxTD domain-containing protein [Acidobacteriota bacterium]